MGSRKALGWAVLAVVKEKTWGKKNDLAEKSIKWIEKKGKIRGTLGDSGGPG